MIESQVPPHHLECQPRKESFTHVCNDGSHVAGRGDVRAGAVLDAGAKRSVISLVASISLCILAFQTRTY